MSDQKPIPPEAFKEMKAVGFVAVKDLGGNISFVPRARARVGVKKGYFTLVPPPDDGVSLV